LRKMFHRRLGWILFMILTRRPGPSVSVDVRLTFGWPAARSGGRNSHHNWVRMSDSAKILDAPRLVLSS
jgi:hypothetical protein